MVMCNDCNVELNFRLSIKDTEDDKTKKLYICPKCGKYCFIHDEK